MPLRYVFADESVDAFSHFDRAIDRSINTVPTGSVSSEKLNVGQFRHGATRLEKH